MKSLIRRKEIQDLKDNLLVQMQVCTLHILLKPLILGGFLFWKEEYKWKTRKK